ncbi:uncharacterized protein LOC128239018 [Mya arenaria]|uniref:uncharacterized protein LOC128239018 n=1 Tax=Mya arenaria TaxID=6604 RepID=UPI0022E76AD1|nr:uncharacterized protein LOC128239018 [Mya arenaria]XP_052811404.1 uncharacterized protein LOC128239018 [Mya arenaria]XP_052811413.1 uncharacterized protein LOC128239018 [Mya arenaria]XP_052811420.1 uncharacterized protein LOC128239018 [Mya arenaria]XP_052811427.1 uncharacterized protein LOC128239018 [Mya arenaria]XP_052811434.1 uncharacterized protein LOC128239018 [Mya arenaria]XP_052811443.1 uncharacterized protein LOC128239018 [Mya arenaria]XP_052811452.1 uncharacterized protein LOC1282
MERSHFVYRVLGPYEKSTEPLSARCPDGCVTVRGHIRRTCKTTQYISTSADLKANKSFLMKAKNYLVSKSLDRPEKYIIVRIDIKKLQKLKKAANIVDLTNQDTLDEHIPKSQTSPDRGFNYNCRLWATETQGVLISNCAIPVKCMKVVYSEPTILYYPLLRKSNLENVILNNHGTFKGYCFLTAEKLKELYNSNYKIVAISICKVTEIKSYTLIDFTEKDIYEVKYKGPQKLAELRRLQVFLKGNIDKEYFEYLERQSDKDDLSTQAQKMTLSPKDAGHAEASIWSCNSSKTSGTTRSEQMKQEKGKKTKANKTEPAQRGTVGGGQTTKASKEKTGDDKQEEDEEEGFAEEEEEEEDEEAEEEDEEEEEEEYDNDDDDEEEVKEEEEEEEEEDEEDEEEEEEYDNDDDEEEEVKEEEEEGEMVEQTYIKETQHKKVANSRSDAGKAAASSSSKSSKTSGNPRLKQTEQKEGKTTKANPTDSAQRGAVGGGPSTKAGKKMEVEEEVEDDYDEEDDDKEESEERADEKKTKPKSRSDAGKAAASSSSKSSKTSGNPKLKQTEQK